MSVNPASAPYRPAYIQDSSTGLYYRIGGGGGSGGSGAVFFGPETPEPDAAAFSQWVVTPANTLRISDGVTWHQIAGGGGGAGQNPIAAFTYTTHWSTVDVNGTTSSDPDGFIAAYDWDWGDGSAHGSGPTASHTYATSGSKIITLRVTDDDGDIHQVFHTVNVTRMYGPVTMTVNTATTSPWLLVADGTSQSVEWVLASTGAVLGTGLNPTINFGSAATRDVQLWVSDPANVRTLNLGFNNMDDFGHFHPGGLPAPDGAGYNYPYQGVIGITGLPVLTGLRNFMCANGPITGHVDVSGLAFLEFFECFHGHIQTVNLTGCTSLIRLCLEENHFAGNTLDLNPVRATLRDIRAAGQAGLTLTALSGPLASLYHLCIRDQPVTGMPSNANIPVIEEQWVWNTGQSGTFYMTNQVEDCRIQQNGFTSIDFTATTPSRTGGQLHAGLQPLTSLPGLAAGRRFWGMDLAGASMNQTLVNQVLAAVNSWGTSSGMLILTGNAAPTNGSSNTDVVALRGRGWTVDIA